MDRYIAIYMVISRNQLFYCGTHFIQVDDNTCDQKSEKIAVTCVELMCVYIQFIRKYDVT